MRALGPKPVRKAPLPHEHHFRPRMAGALLGVAFLSASLGAGAEVGGAEVGGARGGQRPIPATSAGAGGTIFFRGLEVSPLGSSQVTTLGDLLLVTGAVGDEARAQVLAGEVESVASTFELDGPGLPTGSGLVIEASGQVAGAAETGEPRILGRVLLQKSSETAGAATMEVKPAFGSVGASYYELTLLSEGAQVVQLGGRSGVAGHVTLAPDEHPRVEWFAGSQVVLSGFDASLGFVVDGQTYLADQAVLRAEDPTVEGQSLGAVNWSGVSLNQLGVRDLSFNLGGWDHHLAGPLGVSPGAAGLGSFQPESGGEWHVDIDVATVAAWAIGVTAQPQAEATLRFGATAHFDDGNPENWTIELSRRSSEPVAPTRWRTSFGFEGNATLEVLDAGVVVATLPDTSGESILFEPEDFEARMDLSDQSRPELSLSFARPIDLMLVGRGALTGDQVLATPSVPLGDRPVQSLSALELSGLGHSQVGLGPLETELFEKRRAPLGCGGQVTLVLCRPPGGHQHRLEYRVIVETSAQGACYDIKSPTADSSTFKNLVAIGVPVQGSTFLWQGCSKAGTSCQVGFQATPTSIASGQVVSNFATATDLTGQTVTVIKRDLLPGLLTTGLPDCANPIQICDSDDEVIFEDGFECGDTSRWSATVN